MRAVVPRSATTLPGRLGDRQQVIVSSILRGSQPLPACCICNSPVLVETSKTDEYGQAVHEECHVLKLRSAAEFLNDGASTPASASKDVIYQPHQGTMPRDRPKQPDLLATLLMQPAKRVPWHMRPWNGYLAAVVTVLAFACWIAFGDRHPLSFLAPFELQSMATIGEQVPLPPAKTVPAENRPQVSDQSNFGGRREDSHPPPHGGARDESCSHWRRCDGALLHTEGRAASGVRRAISSGLYGRRRECALFRALRS